MLNGKLRMVCVAKKIGAYVIALSAVFFIVPVSAMSASSDAPAPWRYSLYFENDAFFKTDYLYTNGVKLSAASPSAYTWEALGHLPDKVMPIVKAFPLINELEQQYSLMFSMGQVIYTPEDTDRTEPMPGDRPYAGAAFLECGLNALGTSRLTSVGVTLGMAGPHSYAEETQTTIHELIGSNIPGGWDYQIRDTAFLNLSIENSWHYLLFGHPNWFSLEVLPMAGVGLGNAFTFMHTGLQVRAGWNIPNDFGENLIRTGVSKVAYNDTNTSKQEGVSRFSCYLFAGADGQMVAYDLMLDKNRYDYPYTIKSEPLRHTTGWGIGATYGRFGLSFAHVYRSKEYKAQRSGQTYGTLRLSVAY